MRIKDVIQAKASHEVVTIGPDSAATFSRPITRPGVWRVLVRNASGKRGESQGTVSSQGVRACVSPLSMPASGPG